MFSGVKLGHLEIASLVAFCFSQSHELADPGLMPETAEALHMGRPKKCLKITSLATDLRPTTFRLAGPLGHILNGREVS